MLHYMRHTSPAVPFHCPSSLVFYMVSTTQAAYTMILHQRRVHRGGVDLYSAMSVYEGSEVTKSPITDRVPKDLPKTVYGSTRLTSRAQGGFVPPSVRASVISLLYIFIVQI
jgi:hypothetical protein